MRLDEFAITYACAHRPDRGRTLAVLREEMRLLGLNTERIDDEELEHWVLATAAVLRLLGMPQGGTIEAMAETLVRLRELATA